MHKYLNVFMRVCGEHITGHIQLSANEEKETGKA